MKIINRKARFNYELLDRFETGIVLTGAEVKSAKAGHVSLAQAHVRLMGGELFLINATISPYKFAGNQDEQEPNRIRKLLMHKSELLSLTKKMESSNLTLAPTAMYTKHHKVKVEIALARGKKQHQKKQKIKEQDLDREAQKILKTIT
ncbi:SsrA-binding protein SmpB [Candidatus Beckwithbacteria bacterium]|nr:SsrA-binding protein SmpB [Candidatus Beckwithbacteria bacterium]